MCAPKLHIISSSSAETALQVAKLHILQLLDDSDVKEAFCRSVMRRLAIGWFQCREIGPLNSGSNASKRNKQLKAVALAVPLLKGLLLSKSISSGQESSMNVAEVLLHQCETLPW